MPKPTVDDPALGRTVDQLYRPGAKTGPNGSTADALRDERVTGRPEEHLQKAIERINNLKNWIRKNPTADPNDINTAEKLIEDLKDAIRTPPGGPSPSAKPSPRE